MARVNQKGIIQAVSTASTALGTYLDNGALFTRFNSNVQTRAHPSRDLIPDNSVGDGNPNPKKGKVNYFQPINLPHARPMDWTKSIRDIRDALGGAITTVTNTTPGTVDSTIVQLLPGLNPRARNQIESNGGLSLLYGDCYVQSFNVSQQGSAQPQFTSQVSNGGHFKEIADTAIVVTDAVAEGSTLKDKFFDGKRTTLTFVIGATTYNLVNDEKRLFDVNLSYNQNVVVDPSIGDSALDTTVDCDGGYTTNCYIGDRPEDMVKATIKFYAKTTYPEFDDWRGNKDITSFILTFQSCETIGLTTHKTQIEFKIPISSWQITSDVNGSFESYTAEFMAWGGDPTTKALLIPTVRQVAALT